MRGGVPALALALLAPPASAQGVPLDSDARVETLAYSPETPLKLRTTIGGALTVIFAPGEAIRSATVADAAAFKVTVPPQADSLLIQTLHDSMARRLDVHTQLRDYQFEIAVGPPNDVAYAVRLTVAAPPSAPSPPIAAPASGSATYRLRGDHSLRPIKVTDDGARTYIEWGPDQALPAVFASAGADDEETVDSYMRGGVQTIDRVYQRLIFRVGAKSASAERKTTRGGG